MKTIDSALSDHLAARLGIDAHVLIWIEATDASTGADAPFGIWTGDDDRTFTIDAVDREYLGAGSLLDVGPLVSETGYVVRVTRLGLAHLAPDIKDLLTARSLRHAFCTWHQVHFLPGSFDLVAPPRKVFKGRIERMPLPDAAEGEEVKADLELASYAREMTLPLSIKKSDEALKARAPGDGFRKYIAVSGKISTSWGEKREKVAGEGGGGKGNHTGGSGGRPDDRAGKPGRKH